MTSQRRRCETRVVAATMAGIMLLGGCAARVPARPLTPQEAQLRAQSRDFKRTIAEGVGLGLLAGAAAGAAIGAAALPQDRATGAIVGAIIGGVAGGIGGGVAGRYTADKKQRYANEEQRLDA